MKELIDAMVSNPDEFIRLISANLDIFSQKMLLIWILLTL